jgi:hydroxyacylglutathione hydrolase
MQLSVEPGNVALRARVAAVVAARRKGLPTVPFPLGNELSTNPFLRLDAAAVRDVVGASAEDGEVEVFAALRKMKDHFQPRTRPS